MKEDSLSGRQVNYRLEEIIDSAAPRGDGRMPEMDKMPFCIVYGEVPQTICDMLEKELNMQTGSESAKILCHIRGMEEAADGIDAAVRKHRENVEKGNVPVFDDFSFFILFMAEKFRAEEMQAFLRLLQEKCRQKGFGGKYSIRYYCIFDYEVMDGVPVREEMDAFFRENRYPVGIITPNNVYSTDFQRFWKGIQAIAMHIFLSCSHTDGNRFGIMQRETACFYTLGYWKLDVLKQLLADHFISMLEGQSQRTATPEVCRDKVAEAIGQITEFDNSRWLDRFEKMPVLYSSGTEEILRAKWMGLKRTKISLADLYVRLYGQTDSYTRFLESNLEDGIEQERLDSFFNRQIGNFYFVKNQLAAVLEELYKRYEQEREMCREQIRIKECIVPDRQSTIADMIQILRARVWTKEGEAFRYTRRLRLIQSLLEQLETPEFKKKLGTIEARNLEQCNQLKVLRREMAWNDKESSFAEPATVFGEEIDQKLLWQDDILDESVLQNIRLNVEELQQKVCDFLEHNTDAVLNTFLCRLETLKRDKKLELFYAARLRPSYDSREEEILYLNAKYHSEMDWTHRLPYLSIQGRNWQGCSRMELFCIKEIRDLAQIYNMS